MVAEKSKFGSDIVLWLLAAALAIVLFLAEKTPPWTLILLASLAALLVHPVKQIPWIRNTRRRQRFALALMALAVICLGSLVWPSESKSGKNMPDGIGFHRSAAKMFLFLSRDPWAQRSLYFAIGMVTLAMCQKVISKFSAVRKRNGSPTNADKGFLDHKMQAEESMAKLLPVLDGISRVIAKVGTMMESQAVQVSAAMSQGTQKQIKVARQTANMLDRCSNDLDSKCVNLEKIGDLIAEGTFGWLKWMSKNENRGEATQYLVTSLENMVKHLGESIDSANEYLVTTESLRGVSEDMN